MKTLVFNRNSWHYWLATELGSLRTDAVDTNVCDYTRQVIKGIVALAGILLIVGLILWGAGITIAWWVALLIHGYVSAPVAEIITMVIIILGGAGLVAYGQEKTKDYLRERRYAQMERERGLPPKKKADWFLPHAWRSLKEKTCVRVTIEGAYNEDD